MPWRLEGDLHRVGSPAVYVLQPQQSSHTMCGVTGLPDADKLLIASSRSFRQLAFALAAILILLRLPLIQHPTPVHPDESNFIAALGFPEPYPVHHPGYPLWVATGTLTRSLGFSDYGAFQLWSFAASIGIPLMMLAGLRRVLSTGLAWWLALAVGVNPLIWFHAVTAMTYLPAAFVGLTVIGLCRRGIMQRSAASTCGAALVLVIGVFLRADLLIFLGPLLAYAAWRSRPGGWIAGGVLACGIGGYVRLVMMLYTTADGRMPLQSLSHTADVIFGTSVFELGLIDGLARNISKIVINIVWDLGVAAVLIIPATLGLVRSRRSEPQQFRFLSLWALPCLAFLLLMHVVQGYFVLLLLATYCCIGLYLHRRLKPAIATRVAALLAICSLCQFTLYPWSADSTGFKKLLDAKIAFLSATGLRRIDERASIDKPGDFWPTAAHMQTPTDTTSRPD